MCGEVCTEEKGVFEAGGSQEGFRDLADSRGLFAFVVVEGIPSERLDLHLIAPWAVSTPRRIKCRRVMRILVFLQARQLLV